MLRYEVQDKTALITLSRPEKRNAFNRELTQRITEAFQEAGRDTAVRGVLLQAEGPAFCAGADLAYLQSLQNYSAEENLYDSRAVAAMYRAIYTLPKPVACAVQGPALAGGAGLASVCDYVVASPEATFGYTEVRIGFIPAIVSYFLVRRIGRAKAAPLLLSGRIIPAVEARELGIVQEVCSLSDLHEKAWNHLQKIYREVSPAAYATTKHMLDALPLMPLDQALEEAAQLNAQARMTEDCRRGVAAFLNKKALDWNS
ncbi:MAG: enoyl-CoA hydratase-related protein [Flavobacteriales bacterium]|nr:enoyl-CoA hydratase-related protein [Flavobacteriales bacterium]MCX7768220.1 enoyl-CoA hydratase-related protein [Flavobacteriales bacterium]MDW8410142.1 enoyl-CoA hydratase-related protein [Flavobacteriales bacterium]